MEKTLNELAKLGLKHSDTVKKISLFGSRARGDFSARSDFDIAVYFKDEKDYNFLSDVDDINTLHKIDVTIFKENLDEKFKENIKNEEVIIYMGKFQNKLDNLTKAVGKLSELENFSFATESENEILRDNLVQRFEICYELSWKTIREYLIENGLQADSFPIAVLKLAFQHNIIDNEEIWLKMINDRNIASHEYSEEYIAEVAERIKNDYINLFKRLLETLKK